MQQQPDGTSMITTILFDMDGTLIDSEPLSARAWRQAADALHAPVSDEMIRSFVGRPIKAIMNMIAEKLGSREFADTLYADYRARKTLIYDQELELKPQVAESLPALKEAGFRMAVATSSRREITLHNLERLGILDYFESLTTGDEVENGKPNPDIYLLACKRMEAEPAACAVIEDSINGVRSGHAAGCPVFMIPDLTQPDAELRSLCTDVLPDMSKLLDAIRRQNA